MTMAKTSACGSDDKTTIKTPVLRRRMLVKAKIKISRGPRGADMEQQAT
jgi:hypothetical protein